MMSHNPILLSLVVVHTLTLQSDHMSLFSNYLSMQICRLRIETVLLKSNVLSEVQRSLLDGGMHVEDLPTIPQYRTSHLGQHTLPSDSPESFKEANHDIGGPAGLWHFIYRSIYLDQYVSSEFSSPISTRQQQKKYYYCYLDLFAFYAFCCHGLLFLFFIVLCIFLLVRSINFLNCCRLYRAYQKLFTSMHDKGIGPHRTQFRRDENYGKKYRGSNFLLLAFLSKVKWMSALCINTSIVCHVNGDNMYGYRNGIMH